MSDDTTPPQPPEGGFTTPPPPPPPPPAYGSVPPPAYGSAPPPPGAPAYGAPPSGGAGYNGVDALKYGWAKFTKSPGQMLVPGLIYLVAVIIVEVIVQIVLRASLLGTHDCTKTIFGSRVDTVCGPSFITELFGNALTSFIASLVIAALGAGLIKCALNVVDGHEVNAGDIFNYLSRSNVFATAALVGVATFVGTLLCFLPGIVVQFLTAFAMFFVVDKEQGPTESIRSSISFMTSHLGETIVFVLLSIATLIVGTICCVVGVFVAAPVVFLAAAYTFRVLNNEPVSPVA
jgi:uncharacterized membrane protein